jgi:hypothetical protein
MFRSLIASALLVSVLLSGCATPRPDPALLDLGPEAFANPPPQAEEAEKAKDVPDQTRLMRYVIVPLEYTGAILAGLACLCLQGIASKSGGWYPTCSH